MLTLILLFCQINQKTLISALKINLNELINSKKKKHLNISKKEFFSLGSKYFKIIFIDDQVINHKSQKTMSAIIYF